jgi:hypothetical protein
MNKYNIEGNINFFDELYKSLDDTEKISDNVCLITNDELIEPFIKMNCGHTFNYLPLYKDILNHKKKFNNMEGNTSCLKNNEIRCPYCRTKQQSVLPYYPELGLAKINGVNCNESIVKIHQIVNRCEFNLPNPNFYHELEESPTNPLTINCNKSSASKIHVFGIDNDKCYCYKHKYQIIKTFNNNVKQKKKEEEKTLKEQSKHQKAQEKAQEKALEKAKQKEEKEEKKQNKIKIKSENKQYKNSDFNNENTVLGPLIFDSSNSPILPDNCCNQILKTGVNKGTFCGENVFQETLCKRHYNLQKKQENKTK